MNRVEFMEQLESLLQNITPAEREEALQYYNDYFDDAGPESEADVLEALGNPARVAESIKRDLSGGGSAEIPDRREDVDRRHAIVEYQQDGEETADQKKESEGLPTWAIVLIVILGVIASPAIFGLVTGAAGTLIGLVAAWFSLILASGVSAFALFVALIVLVIVGIMCIGVSPLTGLALIGSGLFCAGLAILLMMLTVAMAGIATPAIFKGLVKLFRMLTAKSTKEKKEAEA